MKQLLAIFTTIVLGAAAAQAQTGPGGGRFFNAIDANGDGAIQKSELEAAVAERFAKRDTNGDGNISAAEVQERVDALFAAVDSNGDGTLSKAEMRAKAMAFVLRSLL